MDPSLRTSVLDYIKNFGKERISMKISSYDLRDPVDILIKYLFSILSPLWVYRWDADLLFSPSQ